MEKGEWRRENGQLERLTLFSLAFLQINRSQIQKQLK